ALDETLHGPERRACPQVGDEVPHPAAAGASEQMELAGMPPATRSHQQCDRLVARLPFRLGHVVIPRCWRCHGTLATGGRSGKATSCNRPAMTVPYGGRAMNVCEWVYILAALCIPLGVPIGAVGIILRLCE